MVMFRDTHRVIKQREKMIDPDVEIRTQDSWVGGLGGLSGAVQGSGWVASFYLL